MNPITYAIREIKRRRYRTAVNVTGFVIAISTLITLVMAARGWETCTTAPLNDIGTDIILYYTAPIKPAGEGCYIVNHLFSYPFNQSILADFETVSEVKAAVPILMHRLRAMVFTGIDPSETEINAVLPSSVIDGRYLTPDDGYVAIIDKEYAALKNLTLGSTVNYAADYEVVGIVDVGTTNIMKSHIYVNLPVVQKVLPEKPIGLINMALIQVESPNKVKQAASTLEERWPDARTITGSDLADMASGLIQINEDTAWSISSALAVITILFTVKSQLGNVSERTREIGILKAIGWSNGNIVNQIVMESLIQGAIGGLLGCIFGYILASYVLFTIGGEMGGALKFVSVDPMLLAAGFAIALTSGVVVGLLASWRAARLVPVKAIRAL
jgi:ABC-type antimicrobial peptide transport system permease subunit